VLSMLQRALRSKRSTNETKFPSVNLSLSISQAYCWPPMRRHPRCHSTSVSTTHVVTWSN